MKNNFLKDQNAGFNFAFSSEADNFIDCIGQFIDKHKAVCRQISKNLSDEFPKNMDDQKIYHQKPLDTRRLKKQKENRFNSILNSQREKARRFFSFKKIEKPKMEISGPNDFRVVQRVQITGESIKVKKKHF